jgi:hypothetical protein
MNVFSYSVNVPAQRMADLLTAAIEGGCSYWVNTVRPLGDLPAGHHWYSSGAVLELDGWCFTASFDGPGDEEGSGASVKTVVASDLSRALSLMAEKEPSQLAAFMSEDEDAVTGDVFMQLLLMGDVVYG